MGGNTGQTILAFIVVFVMLAAIYFLARGYFKERRRYQEERAMMMEGVVSKAAITSMITSYIAKIGRDMQFSMLYIDLDNFSDFINAFGQKESDKILERIVKNIESVLPKGVKLARYQEDEFIIFLTTEYNRTDSIDIANKIKDAISRPIKLFGDTQITATASIGLAFYPNHGSTLKDLLNSLKIAIYIIKKNGGDAVRVYSDEMGETSGEHVEYYYQIKHAIQHKEFQLYYHPIIDVNNNELFGVETLLRWNHPEHGMLSPFKFLGIMEQSGDVHWIGLWGLETLIKTYMELKQDFPQQNFLMSLNLSPKQMMNESLPQDFQKILRKYKMNANQIVLEIVEFALFEKQNTIFKNIKKLKELGFLIAIDGFGIDYQTLSKAESLDIDIIKLDNEFLTAEESYMKARFASLLVEFAKKNNYKIICEVIENKEMLEEARNYNIDIMQGFYFSKPLSAEGLRQYIQTEQWKNL